MLVNLYKNAKLNKKGLSLVEVMVTLAIAGIIAVMLSMFISQGTKTFKKQSSIVDLTNESQIISGQLEQCLMEAKALIIRKSSKHIYIYTGQPNYSETSWSNPTGVERTVIVYDGRIYISAAYCTNIDEVDESNLIGSYIDEFNIHIADSSIEAETDELGAILNKKYKNPIVVNLNYKLKWDSSEKNASFTIKLRNNIELCEEN